MSLLNTFFPGQVSYEGNVNHDAPSPAIWGRRPGPPDPAGGFLFFDDFRNFGGSVSTNVGSYNSGAGSYRSYEDTGGSIAQVATNRKGEIAITTDATDNDEVWLAPGGAASVMAMISDSAADAKTLLFEARIKVSQIASGNLFVGFSEEGLAAADTITDAGALADKDFIGFALLEGDLTKLKFVYRKSGQAVQTVVTVATIAAATWYRIGFVYEPSNLAGAKITIYLDGAHVATYVTATNIAAATFPDGEELNMLAGVKNSTTTAIGINLDWWGMYQDR